MECPSCLYLRLPRGRRLSKRLESTPPDLGVVVPRYQKSCHARPSYLPASLTSITALAASTHCLSWATHFLVLFAVKLFGLICVKYDVPVDDDIEVHQKLLVKRTRAFSASTITSRVDLILSECDQQVGLLILGYHHHSQIRRG